MDNIANKDFDAIIVGSGPGGATVARELSKKNKNVLILEWGKHHKITGKITSTAQIVGIPGKNVLLTNKMLALIRAITTGGSSVVYLGTAFPPPVKMLKSYGVDISKEVEEIKKELPHEPLPDELIGPMANRIMNNAQSLGYNWDKLPKFIYPDKCKTNCDKCSLGCPYGAKWNARMFVEEAVNNGAIIINQASVKKAIIENNKAVGVEFKKNGKKYKAFAPQIIISAGGIGSPLILRASGIKNAGYDFFYDPLISVLGAVNDIKGGKEIPMATGMHLEEDGIVMTDLTLPYPAYLAQTAQVFRPDRMFSHSRTLQIMIKVKDDLSGRITDNGKVKKKLEDSDMDKLMKGYDIAKKILKNAGAKNIFKTWYTAAHPGATAKINDILDTNLRTEYENLYVCDCSVIPEEWGLPPTFTLIGLGKRLAKHLVQNTVKETVAVKGNKSPKKKGKKI